MEVIVANKDVKLLNTALELEYKAVASYEGAISLKLLGRKATKMARIFQAHHGHHIAKIKEAIAELEGTPAERLSNEEYIETLPKEDLKNEKSVIKLAIELEREAAVIAVQAVAELSDRKIAQVSASISGDEAMHWAALRNEAGLFPVPVSFIPLSLSEQEYENDEEEEIEEGEEAGQGEDIGEGEQMEECD